VIGPHGENLIFLLSFPRAGSTLLQRILGGHPEIHTTAEPWLMLHPLYALRKTGWEAEYDARTARLGLEAFLDGIPEGRHAYFRMVADLTRRLYSEALAESGKQCFLDKTPRYYFLIPELFEIFPQARYILLLRNPVASFCSRVTTQIEHRHWHILSRFKGDLLEGPARMARAVESPPSRSVTVKYEDLLHEPEAELKRVCAALELAYDPGLIEYGSHDVPAWKLGDQKTVYKRRSPDRANADRWLTALEDPQAWRIAREYLDRLGREALEPLGYNYDEIDAQIEDRRPSRLGLWPTSSFERLLSKPEGEFGRRELARLNRQFLMRRTVHKLQQGGAAGVVQAMWGHLSFHRYEKLASRRRRKTVAEQK